MIYLFSINVTIIYYINFILITRNSRPPKDLLHHPSPEGCLALCDRAGHSVCLPRSDQRGERPRRQEALLPVGGGVRHTGRHGMSGSGRTVSGLLRLKML